jgi:hypothetical protein
LQPPEIAGLTSQAACRWGLDIANAGEIRAKQSLSGHHVANNLETTSRRPRAGEAAMFAAKLLVTGTSFWYVSQQIDLNQVLSATLWMDFRWAGFATLVVMLQIPLVGLRWCNIVDALGARNALHLAP